MTHISIHWQVTVYRWWVGRSRVDTSILWVLEVMIEAWKSYNPKINCLEYGWSWWSRMDDEWQRDQCHLSTASWASLAQHFFIWSNTTQLCPSLFGIPDESPISLGVAGWWTVITIFPQIYISTFIVNYRYMLQAQQQEADCVLFYKYNKLSDVNHTNFTLHLLLIYKVIVT